MYCFSNLSLFVMVLVMAFAGKVSSIQFDLYPGDMRCVGQELDQLEFAVFASSATSKVKDSKQKVLLMVTDPEDQTIINDKVGIGSKLKEIEHKIETRGLYQMCYELQEGKTPVRIFFHVDYKPRAVDGTDKSRKVGKDDLPSLESQLQVMGEKIKEISREIEHARRQEIYLKETGDQTASRVQWFSILSIIILLTTSIWQIIYLRSFFASKKLL